eukprot:gene9132-10105_t
MPLSGANALMVWCQQVTNGYKDVNIRNMTSSWRNGLAFCAIIHHYRPDLINFDKLSKENIAENNDLAFTVAESELDIAALLDVEDMVEMEVPDKLSILTYVSQYYNYFKDKVPGEIPKPSRIASKRHAAFTSNEVPKKKTSVPGVSAAKEVIGASRTPKMSKGTIDRYCARCKGTVYLMERLQVEGKLFHRVCFKCSTCDTLLRMGTYRYIPVEDEFYCDQHYRKRTTSTSSEESRLSPQRTQQKEQDALESLLKSLESKRKTQDVSHDIQPTPSLHSRVENARKMFQQAEKMETDDHTARDKVTEHPKHTELNLKKPPGRPATPPSLAKKDDHKKYSKQTTDSKSTDNIPQRPVYPPVNKLNYSTDDIYSKGVDQGGDQHNKISAVPPLRPIHQPGNNKYQGTDITARSALAQKGGARDFLANVLDKKQGVKDRQGVSHVDVENNATHIYEAPFNTRKAEGEIGISFDNPDYGRNIDLKPVGIYENDTASLLSSERRDLVHDKNVGGVKHELDSDHGRRPKSDSVLSSTSSDGAKKKKLVLKVKKKKNKEHAKQKNEDEHLEEDETQDGQLSEREDEEMEKSKERAKQQNENEHLGEVEIQLSHLGAGEDIEEMKKSKENSERHNQQVVEKSEEESLEEDAKDKEQDYGDDNCRNSEVLIDKIPEKIEEQAVDRMDLDASEEADEGNIAHSKDESNEENVKELEEKFEEDNLVADDKGSEDLKDVEAVVEKKEEELNEKEEYIKDGDNMNKMEDEINREEVEMKEDKSIVEEQDKTEIEKEEVEGEGKKLKVLKYVNPFEESDDEILEDEKSNYEQQKISMNPFEESDDEEVYKGVEKVSESNKSEMDESGVARPIRIRPGTGPKLQMPSVKVREHEKKILNLKMAMKEKESETKEYRNPFEDSDDDLLNEDQAKDVGEKKHNKKYVLKRKHKRPAPQPRPEVKEKETVKTDGNEVPSPNVEDGGEIEGAKGDSLEDERLETFKAYVENSKIEIDHEKRLDERPEELKAGKIDSRGVLPSGMSSPVSASCPSLAAAKPIGINQLDDDKPSSLEGINVVVTLPADRLYSNDIGYVPAKDGIDEKRTEAERQQKVHRLPSVDKDMAAKKKEAAPKRPAPPVPRGVLPYREPVDGKQEGRPSPKSADAKGVEKKDSITKPDMSKDRRKTNAVEVKKSKEKKAPKSGIDKENENKTVIESKALKDKEPRKAEVGKDRKKINVDEAKKSKEKELKGKKKIKDKSPKVKNKDGNRKDLKPAEKVEEKQEVYFVDEKELTLDEIAVELKTNETKQRELEQRGVKMEKKLREQLHGEPEENYMVTWFDLITEKNKMLRRENELIYMSQEIEYHNNQKRVEYEYRLLMEKDESLKTEEDRRAEEQLLAELVNYVARRNKIVEKMEEDRMR